MTRKISTRPATFDPAAFDPVATRVRHDGWTPERQTGFVDALAECGCVEEACGRVGMTTTSAYALRRRPDAQSFRRAWDIALDMAVQRLSDAAFSRAIHGTAHPVFFQGQQVGERRRYDERLTMFILRYRDPVRYGAWLDRCEARQHPEGPAMALARGTNRVADDAWAEELGYPRPRHGPLDTRRHVTPQERDEDEQHEAAARAEARERAEEERDRLDFGRYLASIGCGPDDDYGLGTAAGELTGAEIEDGYRAWRSGAGKDRGDVSPTSPTSAAAAAAGRDGDPRQGHAREEHGRRDGPRSSGDVPRQPRARLAR